METRLSQGRRPDGGRGLRGPVARRRPQRPVECGGSADPLRSLSARQGAARHDARRRDRRHGADRHGGRRLVSARLGTLDRQSRSWPDRLPVRHAAAADAGKPDPAGVEGPAAHARRGRCAPPPLLAHRFLFERGAQPLPARPRGALGTPDSLFETAGRRPCRPARSEEHTSELQSLMCISYAVFCLKKKKKYKNITTTSKTNSIKKKKYKLKKNINKEISITNRIH